MPELPPQAFQRYDETPDENFYRPARLVTHIDEGAVAAVTRLYRERCPAGGAVLDLMSSWVSHLPPEIEYRRVVGLGMNHKELEANPRLSAYTVQNLNANPRLPFADGEFDACGVCVSIQYLTRPVEVLREVGRVLALGGPVVITFSNRCFPTKAVAVWQATGDRGHLELVSGYLREAGNWEGVEALDRSPRTFGVRRGDPLYAVVGGSTGPYHAEG